MSLSATVPPTAGVTAVVHVVSVYSPKVTVPLGESPPVSVAVSVTVIPTPTVADVGLAWVVIPGDAVFTVICSLGSLPPQLVFTLLLASPF